VDNRESPHTTRSAGLHNEDEVYVAVHEHDISAVASIPGKPTVLDHVLLVASTCGTDDELRGLAA
jgi:hypothetical protein